jgi:hypothetical protein
MASQGPKATNEIWCEEGFAWYERDEKKVHYFYFQENGVHFVIFGAIQRNGLNPKFILTMVSRSFSQANVRKINKYKREEDPQTHISCS